jgi:hypothetical protein
MAETYLGADGKLYPVNVERTQEGLQLVLGGVQPQTMKNKLNWLLRSRCSRECGKSRATSV